MCTKCFWQSQETKYNYLEAGLTADLQIVCFPFLENDIVITMSLTNFKIVNKQITHKAWLTLATEREAEKEMEADNSMQTL